MHTFCKLKGDLTYNPNLRKGVSRIETILEICRNGRDLYHYYVPI